MNKHFHICCDGSFGNRYSGLIGGLTLARLCELPVRISWPSTNMCRAKFYDIFSEENSFEVLNLNIREYYSIGSAYNLISCELAYLQFFNSNSRVDPNNLSVDSLISVAESSSNPIFYYTPLLYDWIPEYEIQKTIKGILFHEDIISKVNNFQIEKELKDHYYGIHLRMTDFENIESFDIDYWINFIVKNKIEKFFVCSDDPATEAKFDQLPNAFSYPKVYKTEKYIAEGGWHHPYIDEDGRYSVFNVERGVEHVKEAVIDFLLLSLSDSFETGKHSTFLKMAKRVGNALKL